VRADVQFGFVSYGLAAVAFALLGALLRPANRLWSAPDYRLFLVAWGSAAWAALMALHVRYEFLSLPALIAIEALHAGLWLWLLASLARMQKQPRWLIMAMLAAGPVAALGALFVALADLPGVQVLALLGIGVALVGVLGLEQVYRNAERAGLTPARWLCLGIAGIFVVDLFLYAESLLVQDFDRTAWEVRGLLSALVVLPIAFAARRMPDWSVGLFVSRQVVFFSTSFLLVGAYLVLMSLGGLLVRQSGGQWGPTAQLFFLAASGVLLAALLFSGDMRRRLKTFLAKNFFRNKYDYRGEWLRFVRTLSEREAGETFHRTAIRAVAQIIESPRGVLWVRANPSGNFRPIAEWPWEPHVTADSLLSGSVEISERAALPLFLERTKWVIDLAEHRLKPDLYDHLPIDASMLNCGDDGLIVPLFHVDRLYGLLQLARQPSLGELTFEDRDLLRTVGRHIAAHLSEEDMDRRLNESRQFEAFNRFSAFVLHDLKNSTAQLQLILHNAERHKRNPEFVDDALATVSNTVDRMIKVLAQLGQGGASGSARDVDLAELAERAAQRMSGRKPSPNVQIGARPHVHADSERLTSVIEHIVRNSQDATPENGEVLIEVTAVDGEPRVRVRDNGHGMDVQFVQERLFRPFDTTKGSRGMGIGAYQAREYLRSLGGDVLVQSRPGEGTTFELVFPRVRAERGAA
jgi:putative PEP-CTERM system histidine kinase